MENNKNKIASFIRFIVSMLFFILLTHFMIFQPISEVLEYKISTSINAVDQYELARQGDLSAIARLEQLSYRDSSTAYIMLIAIYRREALHAAGVNMEIPNVSFNSVDLSKSNALILRALQGLSNIELMNVMWVSKSLFNDEETDRIINLSEGMETSGNTNNNIRFKTYSTFDQAIRDKLNACMTKLNEEYANSFMYITKFRSSGSCTETPPDGLKIKSLLSIFYRSWFHR